jgi:hypothetical protein
VYCNFYVLYVFVEKITNTKNIFNADRSPPSFKNIVFMQKAVLLHKKIFYADSSPPSLKKYFLFR